MTIFYCRSLQQPQQLAWAWIPALANCHRTLGKLCIFLHLFTWDNIESTEVLDGPKTCCSVWLHSSSLSIFKVLSPVLTTHSLTTVLSDVTLELWMSWGFYEAGGPFYLQDVERKQKGSSLGFAQRILTFPGFCLLMEFRSIGLSDLTVTLKTQLCSEASGERWAAPTGEQSPVRSNTEDAQAQRCLWGSLRVYSRGLGWHSKPWLLCGNLVATGGSLSINNI